LLKAKRISEEITVNGKKDDQAWKHADKAERFVAEAKDQVPAEYSTTVQAVYDDRALYIIIECKHPDMKKVKIDSKVLKGSIWQNESIEIFLSPKRDYTHYIQLITNPAGVKVANPMGHDFMKNEWEIKARVTDTGWTAECRIPFKALYRDTPMKGEAWGVNFGRNFERKCGLWAPIKGSSHQPQKFGYLVFE
jgi:hypothetical protein